MPDISLYTEAHNKNKVFFLAGETVLSLVVLICYADSSYGSVLMPLGAMLFAAVLFVVFATQPERACCSCLRRAHWVWVDLLRVLMDGGWYLVSSPMLLRDVDEVDAAGLVGATFGLLAALVYACDACGIVRTLRSTGKKSSLHL